MTYRERYKLGKIINSKYSGVYRSWKGDNVYGRGGNYSDLDVLYPREYDSYREYEEAR